MAITPKPIAGWRRRVITAGMGILLWLCPMGAPAQPLVNPGFEAPYNSISASGVSGQIAHGWGDNSSWAAGNKDIYAQETAAANVHGGTASQRIQVNAGFAQ